MEGAMPAHTKLWYLQRFGLLDVLGKPQMQTLEQATRMFEVKRRERIYLPGDPSDQVFLLKTGVVKIATMGPYGRQAILAFLYAGDIFGELALIDDSPRSHAVEAHEDALICAIDRVLFLQIIRYAWGSLTVPALCEVSHKGR